MSKYCFNCMKAFESGSICPECGFDTTEGQSAPMLRYNTVLAERYCVGRCIRATDGDSFTYVGKDARTDRLVHIKEFFVKNLEARAEDGLRIVCRPDKTDFLAELREDFLDMAGKLKKLSEAGDGAGVFDIFEENGTVYYIAGAGEALRLTDIADAYRQERGAAWEKLFPLFDMLISELEMLHLSALVHRGIGADTVFITSSGNIELRGFSIPSARITGKGVGVDLDPGYAAPEQFNGSPYPDRTCDVYSVCALIYRCITGRKYRYGTAREVLFPDDVPVYAQNTILRGLNADPEKRFPTMMELRSALSGEKPAGEPAAPAEPSARPKKSGELRSTRVLFVIGIFLLSLLLLAGVGAAGLYLIFDINVFDFSQFKPKPPSRVFSSLPSSSAAQTVTVVPNLVNLKIDDVMALYGENVKFSIVTEYSDFNAKYPRDYVMEQTPDAGTPSPGLTTITLKVSRGPEYLVFPRILGESLSDAYRSLTKLGFSVYLAEVDESYQEVLDSAGSGLAYKKGIVLGCQYAADSIVRAESDVYIFGSVDRLPEGTVSSVTAPDGTVQGFIVPERQVVSGTVSVVENPDGTRSYYTSEPPRELSYTTSYTYGLFGQIVSSERIYESVPEGAGEVSDVADIFGAVKRIFTPYPVLIRGEVTEAQLADGTVMYVVQPEPIPVPGSMETVSGPNGTVTSVFVPEPRDGEEIPTVSAESSLDPLTGSVSYTFTPAG